MKIRAFYPIGLISDRRSIVMNSLGISLRGKAPANSPGKLVYRQPHLPSVRDLLYSGHYIGFGDKERETYVVTTNPRMSS